ncbi:hypothetical protein D3C77_383770 [compost metagenome]
MAHHSQKLAFGLVRAFRRFLGYEEPFLLGNILSNNIETYVLAIDNDRRNRCKHLYRFAVLIMELIDQFLDARVINGLLQNTLYVFLADKARKALAGHFFDRIACHLHRHVVGIDNVALQIKGKHGVMIVFFQ